MQGILPYLISGISVGGQYALIAIGYTLVYGILRLINFAHGDVFMVAGLIMVYRDLWAFLSRCPGSSRSPTHRSRCWRS